MRRLLEALAEEFRPVAETAIHDTAVNKVKVVGRPGPGLFGIVDFELQVESQHRVEDSTHERDFTLTLGGTL